MEVLNYILTRGVNRQHVHTVSGCSDGDGGGDGGGDGDGNGDNDCDGRLLPTTNAYLRYRLHPIGTALYSGGGCRATVPSA